ncbi:Receptor kinase-like protein xa21 [Thalictrum thalictroides]|uniref:Receptor kinase-like protein xa21 n=1 Tax=Thalictrum thalictroides TaxID=46969 RepID=A0A7J6VP17_THATH|nr:Receptor kinase-like protein xa21 [Thalictrum thalictroides]
MFSRLPNLQVFVAGGNNLTGPLPSSLSNASTLDTIDLSLNNFNGRLPLLGNLPNIPSLKLAGNQLTSDGPSGMAFLTSLVNSPKLQVLALSVNRLRGKLLPSIGNRQPLKRTVTVIHGSTAVRKRKASESCVNDDVISFEGPRRLYTYHDLRSATDNFNEDNVIGVGSFGRVYRGILSDGTPAAIKVFKMDPRNTLKSFLSECEALRNVRHRNLIK